MSGKLSMLICDCRVLLAVICGGELSSEMCSVVPCMHSLFPFWSISESDSGIPTVLLSIGAVLCCQRLQAVFCEERLHIANLGLSHLLFACQAHDTSSRCLAPFPCNVACSDSAALVMTCRLRFTLGAVVDHVPCRHQLPCH